MIVPLRGRVIIREHKERSSIIIDPGRSDLQERSITTHRGTVIDVGPPVFHECGVEVPLGFKPGDVVQFHFEATEKGRTVDWGDHRNVLVMAQREIDAVIEP